VDGTKGFVEFPAPVHATHTVIMQNASGRQEINKAPASLRYQVEEVHRCLAGREQQSRHMPWATSRAL